jgi:PAS domain S-box-containing protein
MPDDRRKVRHFILFGRATHVGFDVDSLRILEVNSAAIKRYGFTKKEFLSKTILDLRLPEDIPLVVKVLPDIRGTKTRYSEFKHVLPKTDRILNVEIMSYPFIYKGFNARLVVAQNIDEKKKSWGGWILPSISWNKF